MSYAIPHIRQSELHLDRFQISDLDDSVIRAIKFVLNQLQDLEIICESEIPVLVAKNIDSERKGEIIREIVRRIIAKNLSENIFNIWHPEFINRHAIEDRINDLIFWDHANRASRRLRGVLKEIVSVYRSLLNLSGEGDPI